MATFTADNRCRVQRTELAPALLTYQINQVKEPNRIIDTPATVRKGADILEPTVFASGHRLMMDLTGITELAAFHIYRLDGTLLLDGALEGARMHQQILELPTGVYVLELIWEEQRFVRRIFL